jgi:hypothetical protein
MKDPLMYSFFVGRAAAEVLYERLEDTLTNALSELGKFDAEQRENLRLFTEEVLAKAEQEARRFDQGTTHPTVVVTEDAEPEDLQQTIDELRADIARTRAEVQAYRTEAI